MSCITQLLTLKGDRKILPITDKVVIEGGGLYNDYEYLIVFTARGTRCGYVALKEKETEIFNKQAENGEYYCPDLDCHGGLTFYSKSHAAKELLQIPCDDMWIGFDAAHCWDAKDMILAEEYFGNCDMVKFYKDNPFSNFNEIHRTYAYMERECKSIIDQILDMSKNANKN